MTPNFRPAVIDLETTARNAAKLASTAGVSLTEAVLHAIGAQKFSSEQVRRIVEIANTEAFSAKYASMDPYNRMVFFEGGPADPTQVLESLRARGEALMSPMTDYQVAPKVAHTFSGPALPDQSREVAVREVANFLNKLSESHEYLVQAVESAKIGLNETMEDLYLESKTAAANGAHGMEILESWSLVDSDVAKLAYARVAALFPPGKVASRHINPNSAIVSAFSAFSKRAEEYGAYVQALTSTEKEILKVSSWLETNADPKTASAAKAVGRFAVGAAKKVVNTAADLGEGAVTHMGGPAWAGKTLGVGALGTGAAVGVKTVNDEKNKWKAQHGFY